MSANDTNEQQPIPRVWLEVHSEGLPRSASMVLRVDLVGVPLEVARQLRVTIANQTSHSVRLDFVPSGRETIERLLGH